MGLVGLELGRRVRGASPVSRGRRHLCARCGSTRELGVPCCFRAVGLGPWACANWGRPVRLRRCMGAAAACPGRLRRGQGCTIGAQLPAAGCVWPLGHSSWALWAWIVWARGAFAREPRSPACACRGGSTRELVFRCLYLLLGVGLCIILCVSLCVRSVRVGFLVFRSVCPVPWVSFSGLPGLPFGCAVRCCTCTSCSRAGP